jgi:anaerobic magnesium-protoporphyrin IX monomethyl ester cyclase
MAIDVLLLYLPVQYGGGKTYGLPPLGVYQLAANLKQAGISAKVLDASIRGLSLEETVDCIRHENPGLIGISALTPHLHSMTQLVRRLATTQYKGRVIVGGPHFNNTKEEYMRSVDVDYAMYSEGDVAFVEFCRTYFSDRNFGAVPNLIHRVDDQIVLNPIGRVVDDLDTLPFPDLSAGDPADYELVYGRYDRAHSMMTSRGCPYLCTFCDVFSVWGRKMRQRTAENVVDELEYNRDRFNVREVFFKDSTFTLNHNWTNSFLDELERRKPGVLWHCNTRVDRVNHDMLKRMKAAGCRGIYYGVESGNQEILDSLKKKIKIPDVERIFKETDDLGIQANAYFMVGNPGETLQTAEDSLALALRLPATLVGVSPAIAYPGTESYQIGVESGLLKDPHWYLQDVDMGKQFLSVTGVTSPGQFDLPGFSPEAQIAFSKKFSRQFFLRPSVLWRLFGRYSSIRLFLRALGFAPSFLKYCLSRYHRPSDARRWATGEHFAPEVAE